MVVVGSTTTTRGVIQSIKTVSLLRIQFILSRVSIPLRDTTAAACCASCIAYGAYLLPLTVNICDVESEEQIAFPDCKGSACTQCVNT